MNRTLNSFAVNLRSATRRAAQNLFRRPHYPWRADPAWRVGSAVDPAEFSRQLSSLQISLQVETSSSVDAQLARR